MHRSWKQSIYFYAHTWNAPLRNESTLCGWETCSLLLPESKACVNQLNAISSARCPCASRTCCHLCSFAVLLPNHKLLHQAANPALHPCHVAGWTGSNMRRRRICTCVRRLAEAARHSHVTGKHLLWFSFASMGHKGTFSSAPLEITSWKMQRHISMYNGALVNAKAKSKWNAHFIRPMKA